MTGNSACGVSRAFLSESSVTSSRASFAFWSAGMFGMRPASADALAAATCGSLSTSTRTPASAAAPPAPDDEAGKPAKVPVSALVKEAQTYVSELLTRELPPQLTYHTLRHTEAVAKECRTLATAASLSPDDTEALLLAAWFHDVGYLDVYDGHEFRSMERAAGWLAQHNVPASRAQLIGDLIKATHRDETPETELGMMLVDADMSNLARDDFRSSAELLRTEWELVLGQTYSSPE